MIDKKKFLLGLLVAAACYIPAMAQQSPIYSQYMLNGLVINPAYASTDESASLTVVGRNQWVGVDGAPKTATMNFYTPLNEKGTSLGFSAMREAITVQTRTDYNVLAAQKVSLSETVQLALGLQAGMSQYKENNSELITTDPTFSSNQAYWKTQVGFGFAVFSENFYLGLSAPAFKSFDLGNSVNKVKSISHYYLQAAYAARVNDDFLVKPSILLRQAQGSGLQYDINTSVLLKEVLWLGVSWRSEKTVTGLVQVRAGTKFQIGYSYDTPMSSNLKGAQTVSHELMLNYRFGWSVDHEILPRVF
jgi:type IX secretion system PorP/SprF family membrane protein